MKRKKAWILCLAVVFLLVCGLGLGVVKYRSDISSAWQEGYDLGYRDGSSSGYNRGYDAGTSENRRIQDRCTLHPPERDITNHGVLIWKIQKYHYPAMKQRRMVILPVRAVIHERRLQ